jgi:hypothetical protein
MIVIAIAAVWLSTFSLTDMHASAIGQVVRAWILLGIFLASGFAAVCYREKRRAFWGGFFVAMLMEIASSILPLQIAPRLGHVTKMFVGYLASHIDVPRLFRPLFNESVNFLLILSFCCLAGYIAASIYVASREAQE